MRYGKIGIINAAYSAKLIKTTHHNSKQTLNKN
jgi:hypothetical protein